MSHVIPLKSVLLGMNEEGLPVTSVFRSRVGGRKRESGVGAVFIITLGIIVCIRYIQLAQYRPAHSSTR